MAVEFVRYETEQRAADALFNELRHYLGHGPGYHAGSEDDPQAQSVAEKTAAAPFVVMLAGGSTPLEVYRRVSENPPRHVHPAAHLMLSDDRYVPTDDARSNYGAIAPLVEHLGLPEERLIHVETSLPIEDSVADFSGRIQSLGTRSAIFALGVLGIGGDGHTASLFSAAAIPEPVPRREDRTDPETGRSDVPFTGGGMLLTPEGSMSAIATGVHGGVPRVSVTPDVLLSFRKLIFFATGAGKRDILYELSRRPEDYPAGRIMLHHPNASIWTNEAPRVR